jgi:hypothetical protein
MLTEYLRIKCRSMFKTTKQLTSSSAQESKHMMDRVYLDIWFSRLLMNLLFRETLEEEAVGDLRRGSNENPTNEMDNEGGVRGLGPQHPRTLP